MAGETNPRMREARYMYLLAEGEEEVFPSQVFDAIYDALKSFILLPPFTGAVCSTVDPEIFFPTAGGFNSVTLAKRICEVCPALNECRTFAIKHDIKFGVWGATTPRERQTLRELLEDAS